MATILESKNVIIRKPHKCWGCGEEFQKGVRMNYIKSIDGGYFSGNYWCEVCQEYWSRHMDYNDEIGFGELKSNDLEEWKKIKLELERE